MLSREERDIALKDSLEEVLARTDPTFAELGTLYRPACITDMRVAMEYGVVVARVQTDRGRAVVIAMKGCVEVFREPLWRYDTGDADALREGEAERIERTRQLLRMVGGTHDA